MSRLVMIVAASENDVIGVDGDLPWKLSADLRRFKKLTMGHAIIMGRKTFESIGRLLPDRKTIILTRNGSFTFPGATVVHSLSSAREQANSDSVQFLVGGAEIYRMALPEVDEIQLTRVHVELEGDTILPPINWDEWSLRSEEKHLADSKNQYDYSFLHYQRVAISGT